ncbi:MAG: hypothetical protein ACLSHA_11190 [Neglectibacter timonensis]
MTWSLRPLIIKLHADQATGPIRPVKLTAQSSPAQAISGDMPYRMELSGSLERVRLPAVANCIRSPAADRPAGFWHRAGQFGSNVLVDFNRRADDKTNAIILIPATAVGQELSAKALLTNLWELDENLV